MAEPRRGRGGVLSPAAGAAGLRRPRAARCACTEPARRPATTVPAWRAWRRDCVSKQQIGRRQSGRSRLGPIWTDPMLRVEGSIEPQGMRCGRRTASPNGSAVEWSCARRPPTAHQSRVRPWPSPPTSSGAMNSGVPHSVNVRSTPTCRRWVVRECRQTRGGRKSREDVGWSRSASE